MWSASPSAATRRGMSAGLSSPSASMMTTVSAGSSSAAKAIPVAIARAAPRFRLSVSIRHLKALLKPSEQIESTNGGREPSSTINIDTSDSGPHNLVSSCSISVRKLALSLKTGMMMIIRFCMLVLSRPVAITQKLVVRRNRQHLYTRNEADRHLSTPLTKAIISFL
jgi:hypothetical protein